MNLGTHPHSHLWRDHHRHKHQTSSQTTRHYERVIAACCFLLVFCNIGLPSTSFSVYQPYIVALPGMGDSSGSIVVATRTLFAFLSMLIVGRFYSTFDCRKGIFIASMFTGAGFVCYGFADTLAPLCLAAALTGAGYGLGGMIGMTLLVNRWFKSEVGTVLGFAALGSGVASVVVPIVAVQVIESFSLSISFWAEAALAFVIGGFVVIFLRNRPADMGLKPYRKHKEGEEVDAPIPPDTGMHMDDASRILMFAAMIMVGALCVGGASYLSILLTSEGYDPTFAALMLAVMGIALSVAKAAIGKMFDALGSRRSTVIVFFVAAVGIGLLCLAPLHNDALIVAGSIAFGAGMAMGTVAMPIWSIEFSRPEERAKVIRNLQVAYTVGTFLFTLAPGILKDLFGSYVVTYVLLLALNLCAGIIVLVVYRRLKSANNAMEDSATLYDSVEGR